MKTVRHPKTVGAGWQQELKALKHANLKSAAPGFYEASGGATMKVKPYSDKTTNGLTKAIIDYLTFSGHYANRINTQGQARVKKIPKFNIISGQLEYLQKVEYTKSTTAKGTPDIDAIISGIAVKIEVKAGNDRIRDEQTAQGNRIQAAGGIYYVASNMADFIAWYKSNFVNNKKIQKEGKSEII
jgi:hypothetical protein